MKANSARLPMLVISSQALRWCGERSWAFNPVHMYAIFVWVFCVGRMRVCAPPTVQVWPYSSSVSRLFICMQYTFGCFVWGVCVSAHLQQCWCGERSCAFNPVYMYAIYVWVFCVGRMHVCAPPTVLVWRALVCI